MTTWTVLRARAQGTRRRAAARCGLENHLPGAVTVVRPDRDACPRRVSSKYRGLELKRLLKRDASQMIERLRVEIDARARQPVN